MRDLMGDLKGNDEEKQIPPPAEKEKKKKDKKGEENTGDVDDGNSEAMKVFFDEIAQIRDNIAALKTTIEQIESTHQRALNVITEEQSTQYVKELEKVMDKANKLAADIRNKLKAMEAQNKKLAKDKTAAQSDLRMRISQHGAAAKKFLDVMTEYKDVQQRYQDKYKQRMQRQFLIVQPNAKPEDIERMMDSEQGPVFAQQILQSGQRAEARRALQDIQERHEDVMRIERSILELQQLFQDMAVLVAAQGELLNQIEAHVQDAVANTEAGVQALHKGVKLQKKTRKKMCIIIVCLIILCVIVGLGVGLGLKFK
ncbi:t-SNARE [Cladochytrium replicatum]|nr:t-SNARE [Cladochytrium replicatum]